MSKEIWTDIGELLGKTIMQICGVENDSEEIHIICTDGSEYLMYHEQECCESVWLEDVAGDVACLVGKPITKAEKTSNSSDDPRTDGYEPDSYTWTYYHIGTVKGYIDLRWYGTSNGYYSEGVDFVRIKDARPPMPENNKPTRKG